jgi:hypothetical protein
MRFDFVRAVGVLVVVTAVAIAGLAGSGMMAPRTVFMMVLPSMIVYAVIAFALGMKHGEYRASH